MADIKDFFIYQEDFSGIAPGATVSGNVNIQADSDFVVQKLTMYADDQTDQTANGQVIPNASILITDTGSGRNLMEAAVPLSALFGNGELPFILPQPKLFVARSTITAQITNNSSAKTYNIKLSFVGYKVFRMRGNG